MALLDFGVRTGAVQSLLPHLHDKKHVIWDWNGTLLLDIQHAVDITNRLLAEEGLTPITVDRYKEIFRFPVIEYYKEIGFDTSPAKFLEICEKFNQYFVDGVHQCELWPGAVDALTHIKKSGRLQSILSASEQNILNHQMKKFGLEHLFDHVTGIADKAAGSKVGRGLELMKKVSVAPEDTVMIGDTDHDLEVAEAMGIDIILVEHGHQDITRLRGIHTKFVKVY